jgi:para-nitrobenzyl esterase
VTRTLAKLLAALPLALAACAATDVGSPVMPGAVNAPPPAMTAPGDALLTSTVWMWTGTVMSDDRRIKPDAPDRYTIEFKPGGAAAFRADCNRGVGSYELTGSALTFGPIALTRAMCPPESKDNDFLKGLASVSGQRFRGSELVLTLRYDSGSMSFAPLR